MHGVGDRGKGDWLLVAAGCWPTLMAFIISSSVWYILAEEPASTIGEVRGVSRTRKLCGFARTIIEI